MKIVSVESAGLESGKDDLCPDLILIHTIDSGRLAEFIRDSLVELSHHEHAKGRECLRQMIARCVSFSPKRLIIMNCGTMYTRHGTAIVAI